MKLSRCLLLCLIASIFVFSSCSFDSLISTEDNDTEQQSLSLQTSRTVSFSDLSTTPNNGGKYYKIPSGTLEVTVTDLPLNKKVRLVRTNPSKNTLSNLGTVKLYSQLGTAITAKNALNSELVQLEDISNYSVDSDVAYEYDDERPHHIPFVDNTDYTSLLYDFEPDSIITDAAPSRMVASSTEANYSIGNTKTFNIISGEDSSNNYTFSTISTTLKAEGTYCYVWVANDNYDNTSSANNDNKITTTQAQNLASQFDSLYQIETALLGDSYKTNPNTNLYINPQKKISILLYDIDQDYSSTQNGGTLGMFWQNDMYKKTNYTISLSSQIQNSNELELLYVDVHFTDRFPSVVFTVIAHEFEHMLYFINKTIKNPTNIASNWFNEMGAMMAEDLLAGYIKQQFSDFEPAYYSTVYRLNDLNESYYSGGILYWHGDINSYATAGIFGCWLLRNYGGVNLIKQLFSNNSVDVASISNAINALGYNETFNDVFTKYALSFAQPDATNYTINKSATSTITTSTGSHSVSLFAANPWNTIYKVNGLTYTGPKYVRENYTGTMRSYGFWITGWQSEQSTQVKLTLSKAGNEENYIVITD